MSHLTHVVRIRPQMYIHVLDQTTNITRVEVGPNTLICKQHEIVIEGPSSMITIPPRHYVEIENPVLRHKDGRVTFDDNGQAELKWGEKEYRLAQDPFPLYPGEILSKKITSLEMVYKNHALHLRCIQNFTYDDNELDAVANAEIKNNEDEDSKISVDTGSKSSKSSKSSKKTFEAGDEWLFEGPAVYVPNSNVEIIKKIEAVVIKQNEALKLVAEQDCIDREGVKRIAGEQWLVRKAGAYLPSVYEKPLNVIKAKVLTDKQALHMRALKTFTDSFGEKRKDGEEWLITNNDIETYIPSVDEFVVKVVKITTLSSRQYCVIVNPFDPKTKTNHWGAKKLVVGEKSFFLHPGERLEKGIENVYVLNEEQGLVLTCTESFNDTLEGKEIKRKPGDRWMIRGPMEYVPPIGAQVLRINKATSLGENEGIYVRNIKTGEVRAVIGQTYLMNENEQLWEKELPREVEELLATPRGYIALDDGKSKSRQFVEEIRARIAKRDRTRVVTYNVPHNHCVQVFDFRENVGRVVFGPALVLLQPAEVITCLTLSGGKPKRGNVVKCLHLRLGPEFSSDIITVETSDHASLTVSLSYNWRFAVKDESNHFENNKLFAVPDFIGDLCKTVSSKVRAAVSSVPFDKFHTTSARLIRSAVFGVDETGHVLDEFYFPANNLVLTGIDIRSIEPTDPKTREALQKSVQLAIEITAKAQEQNARHAQSMVEQVAKGKLERQKLVDQTEAEVARKNLVEVAAETAKVKAVGIAEATAKSKVEAIMIKAKAKLQESELESQAQEIESFSKLEEMKSEQQAELDYLRQSYELKVAHQKALAEIEVKKFEEMCNSVGRDTLKSIALAPPELRQKLLKGLSIDSTLLKGGSIPFVDLQ